MVLLFVILEVIFVLASTTTVDSLWGRLVEASDHWEFRIGESLEKRNGPIKSRKVLYHPYPELFLS